MKFQSFEQSSELAVDPLNLYPSKADGIIRPNEEFGPLYTHLGKELRTNLPAEKNPHVTMPYPTENPTEFIQLMNAAPHLQKTTAAGLFNLLYRVEQGELINDKVPRPNQKSLWTWTAESLCQPSASGRYPRTFLIESAPASGKTLGMGGIVDATVNGQKEGLINGSLAYITHREFHIRQQIIGHKQNIADVLMTFDPEDMQCFLETGIQSFYNHANVDENYGKVTLSTAWKDFIETHENGFDSYKEALDAIKSFFAKRGVETLMKNVSAEGYRACCNTLAALLSRQAVPIMSSDKKLETFTILDQSEFQDNAQTWNDDSIDELVRQDEQRMEWKGDVGFALNEYRKDHLVHALLNKKFESMKKIGVLPDSIKALAITKGSFWGGVHSLPYQKILAQTEIVVVDEAEKLSGAVVQHRIMQFRNQMRSKNKVLPLVFAASAARGLTNMKMPSYDRHSPGLTISEGIEREILPPISVDIVHGKESIADIVNGHFTEIPLLASMGQLQPWERDTLWISNKLDEPEFEKQLREEYESRHPEITVKIIRYYTNLKSSVHKFLNAAMTAEKPDDGSFVRIVIIQPGYASRAISWNRLANITFATDGIINVQSFLGQMGRGLHSHLHHDDPEFSVLVRMHQFENPEVKNKGKRVNPLQFIEHAHPMQEDGNFLWVPGATLKPLAKYQRDQERIANLHLKENEVDVVVLQREKVRSGGLSHVDARSNPTRRTPEEFRRIRDEAKRLGMNDILNRQLLEDVNSPAADEIEYQKNLEIAVSNKIRVANPIPENTPFKDRVDILAERVRYNLPLRVPGDATAFDDPLQIEQGNDDDEDVENIDEITRLHEITDDESLREKVNKEVERLAKRAKKGKV